MALEVELETARKMNNLTLENHKKLIETSRVSQENLLAERDENKLLSKELSENKKIIHTYEAEMKKFSDYAATKERNRLLEDRNLAMPKTRYPNLDHNPNT